MARYRPREGSTQRSRQLRKSPTDAERRLWQLLRQNFPDEHFRRQVPIRRFTVDFISHPHRLAVEVDGGQHGSPRDEARTKLIQAEGYRVIRFWNHEVLSNADGVSMTIAAALDDRSPPPKPSPIKGEGF